MKEGMCDRLKAKMATHAPEQKFSLLFILSRVELISALNGLSSARCNAFSVSELSLGTDYLGACLGSGLLARGTLL
jgi:hypothetical protein